MKGVGEEEIDSVKYFLVLYAFSIVCLIHEHFNFYLSYLKFISKDKTRFNSPRDEESWKWIEETLFGRHIQDLSVKESLFIFSMKDYKGGYESFKKDLEKCNKLSKKEFKF